MKNNAKSPYGASSEGTFFAIGLNYKKADAEVRGRFSVSENAQKHILNAANKWVLAHLPLYQLVIEQSFMGLPKRPKT